MFRIVQSGSVELSFDLYPFSLGTNARADITPTGLAMCELAGSGTDAVRLKMDVQVRFHVRRYPVAIQLSAAEDFDVELLSVLAELELSDELLESDDDPLVELDVELALFDDRLSVT